MSTQDMLDQVLELANAGVRDRFWQLINQPDNAPPSHGGGSSSGGAANLLDLVQKGEPMTATRWEVRTVSDIAEAVRQLADYHVKSLALVVQTPDGEYVISPDGLGGNARNRYVISRSQLGTPMWENGLRREELADPQTAAKLAALVAEFRPPGRLGGESTGRRTGSWTNIVGPARSIVPTFSTSAAGLPSQSLRASMEVVLAGHRLRFTAEAQDIVDDALSVLAPPCSVGVPVAGEPGWSVHVALASAGRDSPRRGQPVFGWADIGRRLEIIDAADGLLVLAGHYREGCAETLIEVDAQSRQTRVFLPPGDGPSRRWPDWVGRMFFGTRLLADGWHLVHAAAVSIDTDAGTRAVLFLAGPHGGKSTLVHRACVELSARLLSDDLVLLQPHSDGVIAVGWPTRVSIPLELLDAATRERASVGATLEALAGGRRRRRMALSPPQYAAMFDVERAGPTTLGAVVVVSPTDTASGPHVLGVDGDVGADRLGAALTVAARVPAQRLMMLDLLGVAGPSTQPPWSTRTARTDLLTVLRDAEVAVVGVSVPDMSRLPSLPVWTALAARVPWIMGGAP